MTPLRFTKMSGAGNDFILIDARTLSRGMNARSLARRLCPRRTSVGADGLILLERKGLCLEYRNCDGSRAFCANGSRCAALWMHENGWAGRDFRMGSIAGPLHARITREGKVSVRLPDARISPGPLILKAAGSRWRVHRIRIGVPHAVVRLPSGRLDGFPVLEVGRALRRHPALGPGGANVDFIELVRGIVRLRTYERGVEDETLSCGTGAAAAAVFAAVHAKLKAPIRVAARGGLLSFTEPWLEGPAETVFRGEVDL
jgi:diaminopimelate epimerase